MCLLYIMSNFMNPKCLESDKRENNGENDDKMDKVGDKRHI